MPLQGKKIIIGITGSIAAYKSAYLVRALIKDGAEVQVIMTDDAKAFISPLTLATLSKRECLSSFVNESASDWNNHVELGLWADAIVVAPATANTLAKMANGLCDNLLLGVYLSARCPVYLAPAMDEDMWKHPSTQNNIDKLKEYDNCIIPVNSGELASGLVGPGRMAEPDEIAAFLNKELSSKKKSDLDGKRILITAGPTYEPIDPVRFIGNHSSGKMGLALADEACRRGAEVHLILGPSNLRPQCNSIKVSLVMTGKEMLEVCSQHFETTDVCIFAAAVADYTPVHPADQKIKKKEDQIGLELKKTSDIAKTFGRLKKSNQLSVGFALETDHELKNAQGKLKKKNFDLIVLNSLNDKGAGFKHNTNKITLIDKHNKIEEFELKSKDLVAVDILNKVESLVNTMSTIRDHK
ncbi:MAG: bifunctional phosphopantothenoylcysteine decarboxylase/phosphopantothenate--cysteine ligase CoaBC [Bacteroidetes bacterium]|nr:bifunctional phosphopantothenoylcysteine decarboxylase/phosphopantothenate--cysteine ligase CoaBC [Bacteroidota bacterium]